ncbi:MAG: M12 family metallo-peptidase [Pseudomonadales bacterium]|nr:M12 family metallo-peptidase [Pseudomonadales bacterium]
MGLPALFRRMFGFVILFVSSMPINAQDASLSIQLGEQIVQLELTAHTPSGSGISADKGNHYKGKVLGIENSWARLSHIGNSWEGVVSAYGELYLVDIDHTQPSPRSLASQVTKATAASDLAEIGACSLHNKDHNFSTRALSATTPTASSASFLALCSSQVDDICLLSEIDFVFDQSFQASYPGDYEARATQMINIVEGYYLNDMNIAFQTLSTTFLSSQVFSSTTDSFTLLQDISSKKRDNDLDFVSKDEALIQFVTARDFDGSTVGVAWLEGFCDSSGYWTSSTVQLVDSISLTALISAHEIGHNLGAGHDGDGNACSSSGYIMAASLNPFVSSFSNCTLSYIQDAIGDASNQDACFDYPYDIEIADLNSSSIVSDETVSRSYRIDSDTASRAINEATISGSIESGSADFSTVTLDDTPCTLSNSNQNYTCVFSNPNTNHLLVVELSGETGSYSLSHSVSVTQNNLAETDSSNNSLTDNFTYTAGGIIEPMPDVEPEDDPVVEEAPTVEETDSGTAQENVSDANDDSSSSGSGGGGSMGIFVLTAIATLVLRRQRLGTV